MDRPGWDEYFLHITEAVKTRADCSKRKIGAIIVKDNRIVSTGYNGAPAGHLGCLEGACPRALSGVAPNSSYDTGPGTCISIHAEANAIIYADYGKCQGATIYISEEPCGGCEKLIMGAGIARIVYPRLHKKNPQSSPWGFFYRV